jgi:hypothetical protein
MQAEKYVYIYMHAMEYYSAINKNKILSFPPETWRELEDIMLSEINQTQKQVPHALSHTWKLKIKST